MWSLDELTAVLQEHQMHNISGGKGTLSSWFHLCRVYRNVNKEQENRYLHRVDSHCGSLELKLLKSVRLWDGPLRTTTASGYKVITINK